MRNIKDNKDNKISDVMWQLKGIAIISVVFAHCNIQIDGTGLSYLLQIISNIGSVGVGIFVFVSGYYFKPCNTGITEFFRKKINTLIIPWIIAATCVWLYIVLRKGGISLIAYINYVLGNGSIYYYMTDFLVILFIFCILSKIFTINNLFCICGIALGQLFLVFEVMDYCLFPTPYLDFVYFSAFFLFGIIVKNNLDWLLRLSATTKKICKICVVIFIILLLLPIKVAYFANYLSLILEIGIIISLFIASLDSNVECKWIDKLGKNSFCIYLWHLPLAGIISNIGSRSVYLAYTSIFWPILILAITTIVILFIKKKLAPKYLYLFGLR